MLRERDAYGAVNVRSFWTRRILRIWPLYFGILGVALVFHGSLRLSISELGLFAVFLGNLAPMLLTHHFPSAFIGALWTVSIEEQFYLSWPLIMRKLSRRGILAFAASLFFACLIARALAVALGASPVFLAQATCCRVDAIAVGLAISASGFRFQKSRAWLALVCSCTLVAMGAWVYLGGSVLSQIFAISIVGLACGGLLVATINSSAMRAQPMSYLGRISYGLYVFHEPGLLFARAIGFLVPVFGLLSTVGISIASYRYFERPFLSLKQRFEILPSRPI
jgi:peptidoglycan/LPS O-acetylase OafA/YrhL